jgi:hypothetical protein
MILKKAMKLFIVFDSIHDSKKEKFRIKIIHDKRKRKTQDQEISQPSSFRLERRLSKSDSQEKFRRGSSESNDDLQLNSKRLSKSVSQEDLPRKSLLRSLTKDRLSRPFDLNEKVSERTNYQQRDREFIYQLPRTKPSDYYRSDREKPRSMRTEYNTDRPRLNNRYLEEDSRTPRFQNRFDDDFKLLRNRFSYHSRT